MKIFIRSLYVKLMRALRTVLKPIGVLRFLESRQSRWAHWLRSLFAIYDIDDMVHLDIPWWTLDATKEVDAFLAHRPGARVFEWGSGASTVWLGKRAGEVISVEHDVVWVEQVARRIVAFDHVHLNTVAAASSGQITSSKFGFEGQYFDEYAAKIDAFDGTFDLIVIDGRAREACLSRAVSRLSSGGIILFDDFKRRRYQIAATQQKLQIRRLEGLAACLPLPSSTALLSHRV
jgi:hypothetical protein